MSKSRQYWIPRGLPEELQVALSIPGPPPKTLGDHRNRLEALLETLAEELEEQVGAGAAARDAYAVIPDENLYLSMSAPPYQVVAMLMESDLMANVYLPEKALGPGVRDPELQERCREAGFQDRLVNFVLAQ
jgi:hypothetical protein